MGDGLGMPTEPFNRCKNWAFHKPQRVLFLLLTILPILTIFDTPKDACSDVFTLSHPQNLVIAFVRHYPLPCKKHGETFISCPAASATLGFLCLCYHSLRLEPACDCGLSSAPRHRRQPQLARP